MQPNNNSLAGTALSNITASIMLHFADSRLQHSLVSTLAAAATSSAEHEAAVAATSIADTLAVAAAAAGSSVMRAASSPSFASSLTAQALYQIPVYAVILMLSVAGNALVILTLVQNRRMRTVTNVFLLNLAVSDLLLGVLCMPITLIGALLRDFVFGGVMCKLMPYLQACSISVSAWTLVAISCERYYAICHPLRSRRWQTLSHAYRLIGLIWSASLLLMLPIAMLSRLIPTSHGHHKCREYWPDDRRYAERIFNVYLDVVLLVLPLIVLASTYSLITSTMWKGIQTERVPLKRQPATPTYAANHSASVNSLLEVYVNGNGTTSTRFTATPPHCAPPVAGDSTNLGAQQRHVSTLAMPQQHNSILPKVIVNEYVALEPVPSTPLPVTTLRRSNTKKHMQNRRRVIKMLFVVVLEFFLCWTPLYVINTLVLFEPELVYQTFGYATISGCQLLAYSSSCCNPITYCFMNRGFRKAFAALFRCCRGGRCSGCQRRGSGSTGIGNGNGNVFGRRRGRDDDG